MIEELLAQITMPLIENIGLASCGPGITFRHITTGLNIYGFVIAALMVFCILVLIKTILENFWYGLLRKSHTLEPFSSTNVSAVMIFILGGFLFWIAPDALLADCTQGIVDTYLR
jgi:hypothetical protein